VTPSPLAQHSDLLAAWCSWSGWPAIPVGGEPISSRLAMAGRAATIVAGGPGVLPVAAAALGTC
jgi:hypothetical protein